MNVENCEISKFILFKRGQYHFFLQNNSSIQYRKVFFNPRQKKKDSLKHLANIYIFDEKYFIANTQYGLKLIS